jgi:hypothetical protein
MWYSAVRVMFERGRRGQEGASLDRKEATHLRDRSTLVVTADELYPLWISQLQARQEADRLYREQAAVDVVA